MRALFRSAVILLLLLASGLPAQADAVGKAVERYRAGDYAAAREGFEQAWREGVRDGRLEYNLGNCAWRLGEPARALVHYRRALQYAPRDRDYRANRDLCRKTLGLDRSTTVPFLRALVGVATAFTRAELVGITAAGSLLFWLALALRALWRHRLPLLLALVGLAALLLGGGQLLWRSLDHPPAALVVAEEVALRSEPRDELEPLATLGAGLEVRILGGGGEWLRVAAGDLKGWLPAAGLGWLDRRRAPWSP